MEEEFAPETESLEGTLFEIPSKKPNKECPFIILAKDPGAANCLSPVINALSERDRHIFIFAKDKAEETFSKNFSEKARILGLNLEEMTEEETVLLASGTSDPQYEGGLIERMKRSNPKTGLVLIEDFPGSLIRLMQRLENSPTPIYPDLVLVTSRSSQENVSARFPNLKNSVIPVGQPYFDSLLSEETPKINKNVRKKLNISPDEILVSYIGVPSQDHPGLNSQALEFTLSSLNSIARERGVKLNLINRNHPREVDPSLYNPLLEDPNNQIKIIGETAHQKFTTREITATSNLVVTTISTNGLETALRGSRSQTKPEHTGWLPLHILLPQAEDFIRSTAGQLPVIELRATAVASSGNEVKDKIEKSLFDNEFKREIIESQKGPLRYEYRFYGKRTSTDRTLLWLRYFEKNKRRLN